MIKRLLATLFSILFIQAIIAQTALSDSAYIRDNYIKKELHITMRDGIRLFTSIYTPKDVSKKYPIMLMRTPYTVAPYGDNIYRTAIQNPTMLHDGYIFVFQDVRGKWMSEGDFMDIRPINPTRKANKDIDESTDTYDTVDWLVKNTPNNNGKVGVRGISYPGFYATNAAIEAHPAVKAVSPQAPVTDWFIGDDFHHGGAFFFDGCLFFLSQFWSPSPKANTAKGFTVCGYYLP